MPNPCGNTTPRGNTSSLLSACKEGRLHAACHVREGNCGAIRKFLLPKRFLHFLETISLAALPLRIQRQRFIGHLSSKGISSRWLIVFALPKAIEGFPLCVSCLTELERAPSHTAAEGPHAFIRHIQKNLCKHIIPRRRLLLLLYPLSQQLVVRPHALSVTYIQKGLVYTEYAYYCNI